MYVLCNTHTHTRMTSRPQVPSQVCESASESESGDQGRDDEAATGTDSDSDEASDGGGRRDAAARAYDTEEDEDDK